MTKKVYLPILKDNLQYSAGLMGIRNNFIFHSDNDPEHTSAMIKSWLEETDLNVLKWSCQSPDLNIIERLWDKLDRRIPKSTSFPDFKIVVFDCWSEIDKEALVKLVDSIPRRLKALLDAHTRIFS